MTIPQIKEYWADKEELCIYKPSQLVNPRLLKSTIDFLINCGLPDRCAPGLDFNTWGDACIKTPNQVFNLDFEELNDYLWIGSNGSGDPVCIDLNNNNEIVYLNHDNDFERVFMNSSVHQLTECIIRYRDFHASLNPRFENNTFIRRKFSEKEFMEVCNDFENIDNKSLLDGNCWKAALEYLLWERDNK